MSRYVIYIAGPMRGIKHFNFPAFDAARDELTEAGYDVISPADLDRAIGFDETAFPDDYDWRDLTKADFSLGEAVRRDIEAIMECNAIYMLDGWQNSTGARAEKALAEWLGKDVRYQTPPTEDVLQEALRITTGDRQAAYGPPDADFARTAAMWSAVKGVPFEPREVALFMLLLKISREVHRPKRDNSVDLAGYARCLDICNRAAGHYE